MKVPNFANTHKRGSCAGSMGLSPVDHKQWAKKNLESYRREISLWENGLNSGHCDYHALLHAHRDLYGVVLNALDSQDKRLARDAQTAMDSLTHFITTLMHVGRGSINQCRRLWSKYRVGAMM
jgi:hypothetical protein